MNFIIPCLEEEDKLLSRKVAVKIIRTEQAAQQPLRPSEQPLERPTYTSGDNCATKGKRHVHFKEMSNREGFGKFYPSERPRIGEYIPGQGNRQTKRRRHRRRWVRWLRAQEDWPRASARRSDATNGRERDRAHRDWHHKPTPPPCRWKPTWGRSLDGRRGGERDQCWRCTWSRARDFRYSSAPAARGRPGHYAARRRPDPDHSEARRRPDHYVARRRPDHSADARDRRRSQRN